MRLLVSVKDAVDAAAALSGGADFIDAKDPTAGSLGPVSAATLLDIRRVVGPSRPVTAALGDASTEQAVEDLARNCAAAGARFVKVGFGNTPSTSRIADFLRCAVRGVAAGSPDGCGVIAVAYADAAGAGTVPYLDLIDVAAASGAVGVLIDTANKAGPGLRGLVDGPTLTRWVAKTHAEGLLAAVAGQLTLRDVPFVRDAGADIAGFRGAVCAGGRNGRVSAEKVSALRDQIVPTTPIVEHA